ncbi:MAG: UDP-3-O-(3-hydroxymyristoyl)glucosamine N-acyltransferase [Desulfatirhabdiaceae bacterium]
MKLSIAEISRLIQGTVHGDSAMIIHGVASFETAKEDQITFAYQPKFLKNLGQTRAGAILVPEHVTNGYGCLIRVKNPQLAFNSLVRHFHPEIHPGLGVNHQACIEDHVIVGENCAIGPFSVIQSGTRIGNRVTIHSHVTIGRDVVIGDDVEIFPQVSILHDTQIGNRVIIQSGSVIGSDGFGYVPEGGVYHKIPHIGYVQIDDDVEIGACNTIDRATLGKTWIQKCVKTDNLVHIAHNVVIGENSLVVAQVGISGSVTIGRGVILAGQAGVSGHLTIGDGATIGPQAGIAQSVPPDTVVSGSPQMPHGQWLRVQRVIARLPELKKKISELEKRLAALEG